MIPARHRLGQELTHAAYSLGWTVTKRVPEPVAMAAFRRISDLIWRRRGSAVRRLEANLARTDPDASPEQLRALSRSGMRSYLRYWCEAFRLPVWSRADIVDRVHTIDEHWLRDGYASPGGAVVALPHMANWDHAGAWACLTGMPLTTVAERLEPERLFARFLAYRESLGMEVLALAGVGNVLPALADRLRAGRLVCLVADRDLTASGVEVRLLGHGAKLPAGPAVLSRATGAALVPATLRYDGPRLVIRFHQPVPPAPGRAGLIAMTQQVADAFSTGIRAAPQDWHMLQRVFTADLPTPGPNP